MREVHDHFVWLDRWLGFFMTRLEADLQPGRVLWVLSSDHGIGEMPEALLAETGGRVSGRLDFQEAVAQALASHGIDRDQVLVQGGSCSPIRRPDAGGVAPTIAALLDVRPTEPVDGVPLRELLERSGR